MNTGQIELVIDDWSSFLQSENIHKNSPSVSIDGLQWNFRVTRPYSFLTEQEDPAIELHLKIGFIQPDPSCLCVCRAVILLNANILEFEAKTEVMVFGEFSYGMHGRILPEQVHVADDIVVFKVHISQLDKYYLSQPSSYTLRGQTGRTKVDGILENIQCPTLLVSYVDDKFENPIELWSFIPFMACSFKRVEFIPLPEIKDPEDVDFEDYRPKQDSKLRPDCKELVIVRSFYPIDDDGIAWMNFIQIRLDLAHDSITNRWLKLPQPPRRHHDGLAFTTLGWVIWKCDKTERCHFRFRIWIFGEKEVECVHDKVIVMALYFLPTVLFTFDKIYSLGVSDMASCALDGDRCFKWITCSIRPVVVSNSGAKFFQWRDSFLLVDIFEDRIFIYEIKMVYSNGENWYNVIPRFAISNVLPGLSNLSVVVSDSLLIFSGPKDIITVFFLQPLSAYASALLVVEKQLARYMGVNWNGDRISLGRLTKEMLHRLKCMKKYENEDI